MGCKCCKVIQSYLFDPVQVPSHGYVNEVSSCKLDEDNTVKLKGKQNSKVLVHKSDLQIEGLKWTESRGRQDGFQEPCWSQQGPHPQGTPGGGQCAEKLCGTANGISPTGNSRPHEGDQGSWASTADNGHPTQPFLEGGDAGREDCVLPASEQEQTQVPRNADSGAPFQPERVALEEQGHVLQMPAPDYPPLWGPNADGVDHEDRDRLFQNPPEHERLQGSGVQGLGAPFSMKRSRDSISEGVAVEGLSVAPADEGPTLLVPVPDSGSEPEDALGSEGDGHGEMPDEDAAVAEALAALEAATAGEDVGEAD